jgi:hypothetical protein
MQHEMADIFGDSTVFEPYLLDVKEMFTGLPHREILKAVDFLIQQTRKQTRSQFIRVPNEKSRKPAFGKSANRFEVSHITFQQITDVVAFDIRSAIFTLGNITFIQREGAPIGGVLSTAEAIATCAYAECLWHTSLGPDARFIRAIRYVDDIFLLTAFSRHHPQTRVLAHSLFNDLRDNCYPHGLILEQEDCKDSSLTFLETNVRVSDNTITASHHNKNIVSIRTTGHQRFFNLQSSRSYSSRNSKRGVIVARLMAISKSSPDDASLSNAVKSLFIELKTLGYGPKLMKQACVRMYHHTNSQVWNKISRSFLSTRSFRSLMFLKE